MKEIKITDIEHFKIRELSDYFFNTDKLTREISNKKIGDITPFEILHLIRRRTYTEIAVILAIKEIETNGFYGYSFNYDDKSIIQQDTLKELLLLEEHFWNYNQQSFHKLKVIAEKKGIHLNLPSKFIEQFFHYKVQPIIWTKEEIETISFYFAMDTASHVCSAWEMVRQLKRAIDEEIEVKFKWEEKIIDLKNVNDLKTIVIPLLPDASEYESILENEVKIGWE
jgi:hypothetical protein